MTVRSLLAPLVALLLFASPNPATAAGPLETKLTALSQSGNGEAAYHLGMLHHMGMRGVRKDPKRAFELFRLAAERGDPLGAYKYGCYFDGQGEGVVEADAGRALKYKMIAAEAGYALAQEDVAKHLFAAQDIKGAVRWLEAAAAQGGLMPMLTLGALYSGDLPQGTAAMSTDRVKAWALQLAAARKVPEMRGKIASLARRVLSKTDFELASAKAAQWQDTPSALTKKAADGVAAAYRLAGLRVPSS